MTLVKTKAVERRIVYRLTITDEPVALRKGKKRVFCTYHNGVKIHGKGPHGSHPTVILSVKDQDEILWAGPVNFLVTLEPVGFVKTRADQVLKRLRSSRITLAENPFYRPEFKASKGHDGVYRVASGPLDRALVTRRAEYKFTVTRLEANGLPDPNSEPLDPHIIVEP